MVHYVIPRASLQLLAAAVGAASLGALLAAVMPARAAASMRPVDALRAN
jgi:ABC-type lipoprotein release transport system permease subunit